MFLVTRNPRKVACARSGLACNRVGLFWLAVFSPRSSSALLVSSDSLTSECRKARRDMLAQLLLTFLASAAAFAPAGLAVRAPMRAARPAVAMTAPLVEVCAQTLTAIITCVCIALSCALPSARGAALPHLTCGQRTHDCIARVGSPPCLPCRR